MALLELARLSLQGAVLDAAILRAAVDLAIGRSDPFTDGTRMNKSAESFGSLLWSLVVGVGVM